MSTKVEDLPNEVVEDIESKLENDEYDIEEERIFEIDAGYDETILALDYTDESMGFMDRIQHPMSGAIVSKRNTGKSYFLRAYVREICEQERTSYIIAFSKTASVNGGFDFLHHRSVFEGYSEEVMKEMFNLMERQIQRIKRKATENPAFSTEAPHLVIILDDVVGSTLPIGDEKQKQEAGRCSTLSEIYAMGRHYKCSIWILTQIATKVLNPVIRNNIDQLIIGTNNEDAMKYLHEATYGFHRVKHFRKFIFEHTQNHNFVLYDNLDAFNTGIKWLVIRAPEDEEPFFVEFTTAEREEEKKKRKREEEQQEREARAQQRIEIRERAAAKRHRPSENYLEDDAIKHFRDIYFE